jgi:AcrR family transcriptional regulator
LTPSATARYFRVITTDAKSAPGDASRATIGATRSYRMVRRAEAVRDTRDRITGAVFELGDPRVALSVVAERAGVSERTILRHFGSRDGLLAAAIAAGRRRIEAERFAAPEGDVDAAIGNLAAHYETHGDRTVRLLAEEGSDAGIDAILAGGRAMHRRWVKEKLGPLLPDVDPATRRRRLAQLVAVCDVYTWKLLRRDSRLGRAETERALRELVLAVLDAKESR